MSDRPVLLFGATGQVGAHLMQILAARRVVLTPHHTEVDFILPDDLRTYIRIARPSIIINAAANTNVDGAEDSPTLAMAVNADAPRIMAEEARQLGIALVHYSTDYVFDGKGGGGEPRSESGLGSYLEGDPAHALGVYGESKWRGEEGVRLISPAHLILRTGWIYGWTRRNFFNTIRTLALEQDELRIVDDQIGTPNWARALAESTVAILDATNGIDIPAMLEVNGGTYHLSAAGATSWFGFATAIVEELAALADWPAVRPVPAVVPIATADYPLPAARPAYSVLDTRAVCQNFDLELEDWRAQLKRCFESA
jgi:dTDP-4-dehydrorhamnose reductase